MAHMVDVDSEHTQPSGEPFRLAHTVTSLQKATPPSCQASCFEMVNMVRPVSSMSVGPLLL